MLVTEKGKPVKSNGTELLYGNVIKSLREVESYKHFKILEAEKFLGEEMKLKVSNEYFRRLKNGLKLNGGNLVQGVISPAVSLLRCSSAFISWRKYE